MIDIKQIESFYPENLRHFKKNLLREYLQHKILGIIFDSALGQNLTFMGGTAIRILHENTRFSEDLDFDNRGLKQKDFEQLMTGVAKQLRLEGYTVEYKNISKGALRCYLRIKDVLFAQKLSPHKEETLLIQIDTVPQKFNYEPRKIILNKFDVFVRITAAPEDLLLAQKIFAIFNRKRALGRDFYDTVFLLDRKSVV